MSSARSALALFFSALLLLLLLLRAALGANPLFHFCSTPGTSPRLTSFLYTKTPSSGFGLGSIGQYQDQVYGLALCRDDTSPSDCKACVADAGTEIRCRCPCNKGGIIWYDNCMFKLLRNRTDPETFNGKVRGLLTGLVEEAYTVPKLYTTGEMGLEDKTKLYGLVQCTRDLSATECKECLEGAIGELPSCCDGKEGGASGWRELQLPI
ncbi:hypothetical protein ACJRO7_001712 [Eucalyptus globulus]|uniref:Gnk2-homologous domain-containing protein n=1 Tax=Eucalyptus globulus TaxID=34317 RepID=A0ABD3LRX8_EUCGL